VVRREELLRVDGGRDTAAHRTFIRFVAENDAIFVLNCISSTFAMVVPQR
jgi:hypothetical protein